MLIPVPRTDGVAEVSREERNFAAEVKKSREDRGWTQEELARKMRTFDLPYVTQSTVSRIEKLSRPVRLMEAQAITVIFGRTVHAMTNPDPREFELILIDINERASRGHYVRFKDELRETAIAQWHAEEDLATISRLYAGEELDPETKAKLEHLERNRRQFAGMLLVDQAKEIVDSVRRSRIEGTLPRATYNEKMFPGG